MKRILLVGAFLFVFSLSTIQAYAQDQKTTQTEVGTSEEEEESSVLKFEPDFLLRNEERKSEIARIRKIIDTLDVSDRKRLKLIEDIYKNNKTKRLKKALLVDTKFEDSEE